MSADAFDADLYRWDAWRPEQVARVLAGVRAPWYVAAGWAIDLPYADLILHTDAGVPFVRPEIALLFKAKHVRPRDDDDLQAVLPALEPQRRVWLAEWLECIHPGHRWLEVVRP